MNAAAGTSNCTAEVTAGGTVYCIASQTAPSTATIPAGSEQAIVRFVYEATPGAAPGATTALAVVGCLGVPSPWPVVLTVDFASVTPGVAGGTLIVESGPCGFMRGDTNQDGGVDISDAVTVLAYLFEPGSDPMHCRSAGDANDDGLLDIADAIKLLAHLFGSDGPLAEPFGACGPDPTPDGLDCVSFPACR